MSLLNSILQGTGKTTTLVEAIKQIMYSDSDVKILACAPSNSAADIIAESLLDLGPSQLFRLNSFSREYKHLPKSLQDFSLVNTNKIFAMPEVAILKSYRVVVSTCITAGAAYGLGIPPGHFTHIFVDEAGQAAEPEAAIPLNTLAGRFTNIIVAGDNRQLGPILHSPVARDLGMRASLLDRLMDRAVYDLETKRGLK
jgi:helicase MOV-10